MRLRIWISLLIIILFYLILLFFKKQNIFFYQFDKNLIQRYFLSQDIPHEVAGKRLFLSDADIYLATGYLYVQGYDPSQYNFEHPPLIKYLFGYSVKFLNNPYIIQIFLAVLFLISYYYMGLKIYKTLIVPSIASLFIILDPLFLDLSSKTLLDIGQILFLMFYFISFFFFKKNYLLQGIALALFAGTKFWIAPLFFVGLFAVYKIFKKELNLKVFLLHLIIAFVIYSSFYIQTFILKNGNFDIIWHILKTFKYRLDHNTSSFFGASLILFLTSYLKSWWGNKDIIRIDPWSIFWPISLFFTVIYSWKLWSDRIINLKLLIAVIPFTYLLYLGIQAPLPRYFMLILPFSYIVIAEFIYEKILKDKSKKLLTN